MIRRIGDLEYDTYRGRAIDRSEPAWVYRNLMRTDGAWYSIVQRNLVVGHARAITLAAARFVVRPGGRERTRRSQVRNVHAFVVGRVDPWMTAELAASTMGPGYRVRYSPYDDVPGFVDVGRPEAPLCRARYVVLNGGGAIAWGTP